VEEPLLGLVSEDRTHGLDLLAQERLEEAEHAVVVAVLEQVRREPQHFEHRRVERRIADAGVMKPVCRHRDCAGEVLRHAAFGERRLVQRLQVDGCGELLPALQADGERGIARRGAFEAELSSDLPALTPHCFHAEISHSSWRRM